MKSIRFDSQDICQLGQGTWNMGRDRAKRADEQRALRCGIDLGMTLIDTAELYENEEFVGEVLRSCREQCFVVSKVHPKNASRKGTIEACERSLRRLKTDYIDLYLLHWIGQYPFEEFVASAQELQRAGKIRHWGVSNLDVEDMERIYAIEGGKGCATNQVLYNLQERGVEYDLLPWSESRNMPVMAYSPLGAGGLSDNALLM